MWCVFINIYLDIQIMMRYMMVFRDSQQTFANRGRIFLVSIFGRFRETMDSYISYVKYNFGLNFSVFSSFCHNFYTKGGLADQKLGERLKKVINKTKFVWGRHPPTLEKNNMFLYFTTYLFAINVA